MALSKYEIDAAANDLHNAWVTANPVTRLSDRYGNAAAFRTLFSIV